MPHYPSETGCCPRFDPAPWEEKQHRWENKLFIKDRVRCFFYMPLNFGAAMRRSLALLEKSNAFTPEPPLVLSDHTSRWNMDLYIEVTREVPGADNVKLSGTYLSKVFDGPFSKTGEWGKAMKSWVESRGQTIKRHLMYYTCCPKCARHYGHNYVVYFAEI